ncbi:hypothetical protein APA_3968 [Pseudanabaena sp. lw0831]|nr:hypothetical protein APA_3968 [Pseudanabaena sp. lw0831]
MREGLLRKPSLKAKKAKALLSRAFAFFVYKFCKFNPN